MADSIKNSNYTNYTDVIARGLNSQSQTNTRVLLFVHEPWDASKVLKLNRLLKTTPTFEWYKSLVSIDKCMKSNLTENKY